ncbi:hypothetical protein NDU88_002278 [Pleurodeles waltl]|uniref:Uncharacterized protein n=1 Tax=Pleurodeles waltl TaxID=8319 RepID=A0AAV7RDB6_PLEWA|nr:hypothetical protein NDU88_002278 [Pleurodeles waltl]
MWGLYCCQSPRPRNQSPIPMFCTYRLDTGAIFEEVRSFSSDSLQRAPPTRVSTAECAHRWALDLLPSDTPDEAGDHSVTGILSADPEHGGRQLPRLGRHFMDVGHGGRAEASASQLTLTNRIRLHRCVRALPQGLVSCIKLL